MPKEHKKRQIREQTLAMLYLREFQEKATLKQSLLTGTVEKLISGRALKPNTKKHVDYLLEGITQNQKKIDQLIHNTSQFWKMERISLIDLNIMRIAIYEMYYQKPPLPFKVCINEAVEIAKKYSTKQSAGFINGNLDTLSKNVSTP